MMFPVGRYPFAPTLVALLIVSGNATPSIAGTLELGGSIANEVRVFPGSRSFRGQDRSVVSPSLVLTPELTYRSEGGNDLVTFTPYVRLDANDERRSHADVRELKWVHLANSWDMTAGVGKVFWGVAESRHLVDIINQTDGVDNLDGDAKLGQPMINTNAITDWGTFGLFVLPGFRERTFADDEARLRGPKPVQAADATYDSRATNKHVDIAVRWSRSIGNADIGISQFHGTGREPVMRTVTRADGISAFQPHYDIIDQTGLDAQYTSGSWLWKLEAMGRAGQGKRFAASVSGLEYTFYQVADSTADVGVLAEYLYDGRDKTAPATPYDNDLFVGTRLTLNDEQDTSILLGGIIDTQTRESFLSVKADRRLTDHWKMKFEARWTANVPSDGFYNGVRNDEYLMLRLARFF